MLAHIIARKEIERRAGKGVFFWGVGNAPSKAINSVSQYRQSVPLFFSIMKSKPKLQDRSPEKIVAWRKYVDAAGDLRELPAHVLVTSRLTTRACHYALMCRSDLPLALNDYGEFRPRDWRNASGNGREVGSSQVTALLRRVSESSGASYQVAIQAQLTGAFWVKLLDPIELTKSNVMALREVPTGVRAWKEFVAKIRAMPKRSARTKPHKSPEQLSLFRV